MLKDKFMADLCEIELETVLKFSMWKFMDNKKIVDDLEGFYNDLLEVPENFTHYFPEEYSEKCKKYNENLKSRISSSDEIASKNFTLIILELS